MSSLSTIIKASNVELLDYPLEASIRHALVFSDEVCVTVGVSIDKTLDIVESLSREFGSRVKYKSVDFPHDIMWHQRVWEVGSSLATCDWLMAIDADEAVHEKYAPHIRELLRDKEKRFVSFPMNHLYGSPDFVVDIAVSEHFYDRHCRMGHRSRLFGIKNFRIPGVNDRPVDDVVGVVDGKEVALHAYDGRLMRITNIPIDHYGWCRTGLSMGIRQSLGPAWYLNSPKLFTTENVVPFNYHKIDVKLKPYTAEHPTFVKNLWFSTPPHPEEWASLRNSLERKLG